MPHSFTLKDEDGGEHVYEVNDHEPAEGIEIMGLFAQFGLGAVTGSLDLTAVLPYRKLVADLLKYTTRDGLTLRAPVAFRDAYRRNYGELLRAIGEVVEYNRFLSLSAGMKNEKLTLEAILSRMLALRGKRPAPRSSASTGSSGGPDSGPTSESGEAPPASPSGT